MSHPQTEAEIESAVAIANVPALIMLVYQFTGDERWLDARYAPRRGKGLDDNDTGGLPTATQDEIRAAAVDALVRMERGEKPKIVTPPREDMVRLMSFYVGEQVAEEYGEMLATEIALRVVGPPTVTPVPAPAHFRAVIIGAGVGGLLAAKLLRDLDVPYVLIEKQDAPGGNWWQNTYPGAGVDTPSHLYSFSFALRDWSQHFERRDAIQKYLADTFDAVGAAPNTRFGTEVLSAIFDDATQTWRVTVRSGDETEVLTANTVLSAVGVLNKKKMPNVVGIDRFQGRSFHSSEWPADLDLAGKRVAVVGTGATSMQIVPAIADQVGTLTVFQRTPQWVAPFGKFMKPISPELRQLIARSPIYRSWYWLRLFWQFGDNVIAALKKDPEWAHPERSMNRWNDGHREFFLKYIEDQLGDRTDLLAKTIPDYPPFGKRILLDNGWFQALRRNNVTLVSDGVREVDATGLTTATGEHHDFDVIVWASGFDTTTFLSSLDVRGRNGLRLTDAWEKDDPRAYLGMVTPGFPNLFMIGGPQTLPGSGSYMFCVELQIRYLAQVFRWMFAHHAASVDIRPEVNDAYNTKLDVGHANLVWTHPGFTTYYRNSKGRVVFISPFRNVEFWHLTKTANMAEYEVAGLAQGAEATEGAA
jgi:4-hydroxyacetophenone monooxygenase